MTEGVGRLVASCSAEMEDAVKLILKRDQDTGFLGGISFVLEARVVLTPEEEALVKKYKAHKEALFTGSGGSKEFTINDLLNGVRDKCKDVKILRKNEAVYKEAAGYFRDILETMASFGGEQVIEYKLFESQEGASV